MRELAVRAYYVFLRNRSMDLETACQHVVDEAVPEEVVGKTFGELKQLRLMTIANVYLLASSDFQIRAEADTEINKLKEHLKQKK